MDDADRILLHDIVKEEEEVSLNEVPQLFFSGDTKPNQRLDLNNDDELVEKPQRSVIAASLLLMKGFGKVKSPVLRAGRVVESLGNLISNSASIGDLASKLLHGYPPDAKSANYRSMVSLLDGRMDLDKNIKPGDPRYRAALSVMASKLAYENRALIMHTVRNDWNMEFLECFNCWNDFQEEYSTQAFMFADKKVDAKLIVVAFRGTEIFNMDDWSVDVDLSWQEIPYFGKAHAGFLKALGLQRPGRWPKELSSDDVKSGVYYVVRDKLKELLEFHPEAKFILTGHSLGGALAALYPIVLALQDEKAILERLEAVYTFGQPRVGDEKLGKLMTRLLDGEKQRYFRFVYNNDVVPRVPFDHSSFLFKHWGKCFYYNNCYKGEVVEELPEKNYFSVVDFWKKRASATWELFRSFWIGWIEGPEYREGWAQICARLLGLVSPGLANHGFQDYVNCTRLGNPLEDSHQKLD